MKESAVCNDTAGSDPVWDNIRREAEEMASAEPLLASFVHAGVLHNETLEKALSFRLALKLASPDMPQAVLRDLADRAYARMPRLGRAARADLQAIYERDPSCHRLVVPLLFYKGFQAVQAYRLGHFLWTHGQQDMARFLQMQISEVFTIDIHPAARLGYGLMIDHGHGIVIGETAVVGNNVSMLHSVTLGGTGKEDGDRHPKIGDCVLIGAGAKVLGNIAVGKCSRVAAGSVVLEDVPDRSTVAGVPARVVGEAGCAEPSVEMDQLLNHARSG